MHGTMPVKENIVKVKQIGIKRLGAAMNVEESQSSNRLKLNCFRTTIVSVDLERDWH